MKQQFKKKIVPILGLSVFAFAGIAGPASAQGTGGSTGKATEMLTAFMTDATSAMQLLSDLLLVIFGAALSGSTGYMAVAMYKRITGI